MSRRVLSDEQYEDRADYYYDQGYRAAMRQAVIAVGFVAFVIVGCLVIASRPAQAATKPPVAASARVIPGPHVAPLIVRQAVQDVQRHYLPTLYVDCRWKVCAFYSHSGSVTGTLWHRPDGTWKVTTILIKDFHAKPVAAPSL